MSSLNDILTAAEALPSAERAELIVAMWDRLSPEDWVPPSSDWVREANLRSDALEAGETNATSWTEVRERARRKVGLDG